MSAPRVFVYVQHLLGIGHLKRAATLARALAAEGMQVTLASGGAVVPGMAVDKVKFVQLPPASAADMRFKSLVDEAGRAVDDAWKRQRSAALLDAWRAADAHVLVLELFPFGRRQMPHDVRTSERARCRRPIEGVLRDEPSETGGAAACRIERTQQISDALGYGGRLLGEVAGREVAPLSEPTRRRILQLEMVEAGGEKHEVPRHVKRQGAQPSLTRRQQQLIKEH